MGWIEDQEEEEEDEEKKLKEIILLVCHSIILFAVFRLLVSCSFFVFSSPDFLVSTFLAEMSVLLHSTLMAHYTAHHIIPHHSPDQPSTAQSIMPLPHQIIHFLSHLLLFFSFLLPFPHLRFHLIHALLSHTPIHPSVLTRAHPPTSPSAQQPN